MLSAHSFLIAAIFIPYLVMMVTLGAYIWRSGQPREDPGEQPGDSEPDRDPDGLLAAA